jgi:D-aminoacyl-tRNA deacylase
MFALLQRVKFAEVVVAGKVIGAIKQGILLISAVEPDDAEGIADRMVERVLGYRIFSDNAGKMNLSVKDIHGQLLIVPQFTLAADTTKGMRPSFSSAASPEIGKKLYDYFVRQLQQQYPDKIATGEFGADMQITLCNDGPVTFMLKTGVRS